MKNLVIFLFAVFLLSGCKDDLNEDISINVYARNFEKTLLSHNDTIDDSEDIIIAKPRLSSLLSTFYIEKSIIGLTRGYADYGTCNTSAEYWNSYKPHVVDSINAHNSLFLYNYELHDSTNGNSIHSAYGYHMTNESTELLYTSKKYKLDCLLHVNSNQMIIECGNHLDTILPGETFAHFDTVVLENSYGYTKSTVELKTTFHNLGNYNIEQFEFIVPDVEITN